MPEDPNDPNAQPTAKPPEGDEPAQPAPDSKEPAGDGGDAPEVFDREYVEKLRAENAKRRKEAQTLKEQLEEKDKAAERAKLDEVERMKAEKADLEEKLTQAQQQSQRAEWKASLAGKVANADAALKLLDEERHVDDDGNILVDKLLEDYDFLAPKQEGPTPTTGAGGGTMSGNRAQAATLQEQLEKARTRQERVSLQRQIADLQKG